MCANRLMGTREVLAVPVGRTEATTHDRTLPVLAPAAAGRGHFFLNVQGLRLGAATAPGRRGRATMATE